MNESDETVPDTVPQVVSDDANIEDHTKSSASLSDSDKSFSEGDRHSSSSSGEKRATRVKRGHSQPCAKIN